MILAAATENDGSLGTRARVPPETGAREHEGVGELVCANRLQAAGPHAPRLLPADAPNPAAHAAHGPHRGHCVEGHEDHGLVTSSR